MPDTTSDFEGQLRSRLADLVASGPDASSRHDAIDARVAAHNRRFVQRRRLLIGSAATTTAVVGGGLAWQLTRGDGQPHRVTVGPTPDPGGDGPSGWQHIAVAPLSPRVDPHVVWAGDRLIVWGGVAFGGSDHLLPPDGASWDRSSASWTPIATAPAGAIGGGFALWNGDEVLVGLTEGDSSAPWNDGGSEANGVYGIVGYRPAADTWRHIAPVEADTDERLRSARQATVVGGDLLVAVRPALPGAAGHDQDILLIDIATGNRTAIEPGPFAASPYPDASSEVALATVGDLVVAIPNWDLRPWVLEPGSWSWHQLSAPPAAHSLHLLPATAAGDLAVCFESSGSRPWVLDPTIDGDAAWTRASENPFPHARWSYESVWGDTELFVPGAAYNPASDTWRRVTPPPRGENRQRALNSAWADGALLLFGGEEYTCPDAALCDRGRTEPDSLDGWIVGAP